MSDLQEQRTGYLGVDPGRSGGVVSIWNGRVRSLSLKCTENDLWHWLNSNEISGHPCFAYVELVTGYVGGPREHNPGSSMFKFGTSYGILQMGLIAAEIPFELVSAQTWQKAFGIKKHKGEKDNLWKNRLKSLAQHLFPQEAVTLSTADAFLIAEYCRRKREGNL